MIPHGETPILLKTAAKLACFQIPGWQPSMKTMFRWWQVGLRGVRLEAWRIGHNVVTTEAACNRFLLALNNDNHVVQNQPTAAAERADAELAAAGL